MTVDSGEEIPPASIWIAVEEWRPSAEGTPKPAISSGVGDLCSAKDLQVDVEASGFTRIAGSGFTPNAGASLLFTSPSGLNSYTMWESSTLAETYTPTTGLLPSTRAPVSSILYRS